MLIPTRLSPLKQALQVGRWLGPWAPSAQMPGGVQRHTVEVPALTPGQKPFALWIYTPPGRATNAMLFVPGLTPIGAADVRVVRTATIFASAGIIVCTPFIPDYLAMHATEGAITDLQRAFDTFLEQPGIAAFRPGVFGVSFGSLLALRLMSSPKYRDMIGESIIFGGYADWNETIHYCLTGEVNGALVARRDPLNRPAVYINVLPDIEPAPEDPNLLIQAWTRYIHLTWRANEHYSRPAAYQGLAKALSLDLPPEYRDLFLQGVGAPPFEDHAAAAAAIARRGARNTYLDPLPHLEGIRCPVHLIHARNDVVIPCNQVDRLAAAMPSNLPVRTYKTGLYHHSGVQAGALNRLPGVLGELSILRSFVWALLQRGF